MLKAYIYSIYVCVSVPNSLSGIFHIAEETEFEGQLGTANLLREKLNVSSSPINTPQCGDDICFLGG